MSKVKASQSRETVDVGSILKSVQALTEGQKQTLRRIGKSKNEIVDFGFDKASGALVVELLPRWEREDSREGNFRLGRTYPRTIFKDGSWHQDGLSKGSKTRLDAVSVQRRVKMISSDPFTHPLKVKGAEVKTDELETVDA